MTSRSKVGVGTVFATVFYIEMSDIGIGGILNYYIYIGFAIP